MIYIHAAIFKFVFVETSFHSETPEQHENGPLLTCFSNNKTASQPISNKELERQNCMTMTNNNSHSAVHTNISYCGWIWSQVIIIYRSFWFWWQTAEQNGKLCSHEPAINTYANDSGYALYIYINI